MIFYIIILILSIVIFFFKSWLYNSIYYKLIRYNYPYVYFHKGSVRVEFERFEWRKKFITNDYDIKYENITEDVLFRERSSFAIKNKRGIKSIYFRDDIVLYFSPIKFYKDYNFLKNNPPLSNIERKRQKRDSLIDNILK